MQNHNVNVVVVFVKVVLTTWQTKLRQMKGEMMAMKSMGSQTKHDKSRWISWSVSR